MNKQTMDIGFANLVVYKTEEPGLFSEFSIHLEEKETGLIHQDIALVRASVNEDLQPIPDSIDCLVWGDYEDEDYTHKFAIKLYKNDEEAKT